MPQKALRRRSSDLQLAPARPRSMRTLVHIGAPVEFCCYADLRCIYEVPKKPRGIGRIAAWNRAKPSRSGNSLCSS